MRGWRMEADVSGARLVLVTSMLAGVALALGCGTSSSGSAPKKSPMSPPPNLPSVAVFMSNLLASPSCALACTASCKEADDPWVCPALADWKTIPHAPACGSFDGTTTAMPVQGKCNASIPIGDAVATASKTGNVILPDGRRVAPAGTEWLFDES